MKLFEKITKSIVYHCTDKPKHYVHVDKPKSLQDKRQVQYNNWCKAKAVYNGSYLPKDTEKLTESGKKGCKDTTVGKNNKYSRDFVRKSSGQMVRYDEKVNNSNKYYDRYGRFCANKSPESHIAPLDKDYKMK